MGEEEEAEDSAGGGGSQRLPEPPPRVSLRCPGAPWGVEGGLRGGEGGGKRFWGAGLNWGRA